MADTNVHRIWATTGSFGAWDDSRSSRGGVRHLGHEDTLIAGRRIEKEGEAEQHYSLLMTLVVIKQWICIVLGITCMVSGIAGIAMDPSQNDLYADLPWSKSIYVPLLQMMAVICLALGIVLVRLRWRSLIAPRVAPAHE